MRFFLTPARLRSLLIAQVAEQTGGKLELGSAVFHIGSGLELLDVAFYPPAPGDTRGSLSGGAVTSAPLARFKRLTLRYSLAKLLAGRVHVKALELIEPQIYLRQIDGIGSPAAIAAYRAVHYPAPPELMGPPKPEPAPVQVPSKTAVPFNPALLYMPVDLLVQDVGITNLSFALDKEEHGQLQETLRASGASLAMALHWRGTQSSLWVNSLSPFERPLRLAIEQAKPAAAAATSAPGAAAGWHETLHVASALNIALEVQDLHKLKLDTAVRLLELRTPAAGYTNLGAFLRARLGLSDDLKGIVVDGLSLEVANALSYDLAGQVLAENSSFQQLNVKVRQKLGVDLTAAAQLAKPFKPDLQAGGRIDLDELKIDGRIDTTKLADLGKTLPLPYISGVLWLHEAFVATAQLGATMQPVDGALTLAAAPALAGTGSQVDLSLDLSVPKLETEKTTALGPIAAGVEGFVAKVTARALWPQMILPLLKVNLEVAHLRAHGPHIAAVDVPLYLEIEGEGRQDLEQLAAEANLELTGLAELSAMADCQSTCERFRSTLQARLRSLSKVHAMLLPLSETLKLGAFMPTKLAGSIDLQLAARGRIPNPKTTPQAELIKKADVDVSGQLELSKLDVDLPFDDLKVRNFETRLIVGATSSDQKLDFTQKFDSLSLALPKGEGTPPQMLAIDRFNFATTLANRIEGPLDITDKPALLHQLMSSLSAQLFVGKLEMAGPLPRPLTDTQLRLDVHQEHLTDISLRELSLRLPDYGANVSLSADTAIDETYFPTNLKALLKTQVVHTGDEKLPGGVKTTGKVDVQIGLASSDMRALAVDGYASFDHFNLTIPGKEPGSPAAVVVEGVDGQIPFRQTLLLPDLHKAKAAAKEPSALQKAVAAQANVAPVPGPTKDTVPLVAARDDDGTESAVDASELSHAMNKYLAKTTEKIPPGTSLVAMVDYGTIRPFYPERRPISIKRIDVANLELSDMELDLELRQNWLALNQFLVSFLGGKIEGDFQLAFDTTEPNPKDIPRSIRASLHMTQLDTRKLIERFPNLKGKAASWDLFSNPYIDATLHLQFDVLSSDISGGLEITSIGKEQLRMLLFYVDPYEQNPTIGSIRKALAFGELRQVSIPLKNGEVGLEVDVRLLQAPIPLPKLSRFPISQILQNFKEQSSSG